jgi:hypothetical protein
MVKYPELKDENENMDESIVDNKHVKWSKCNTSKYIIIL